NDLWVVSVGCNEGTYQSNFTELSTCTPCAQGNYSMYPGSAVCRTCPSGYSTESIGATSIYDCSVCNACHHGQCDNATWPIPNCKCDFEYIPADNCTIPWVWVGIAFGLLVTITVSAKLIQKYRYYRREIRKNKEIIE